MKISLLCSSFTCFLNSDLFKKTSYGTSDTQSYSWTYPLSNWERIFYWSLMIFPFIWCYDYLIFITLCLFNLNVSIKLFNDLNWLFFAYVFSMFFFIYVSVVNVLRHWTHWNVWTFCLSLFTIFQLSFQKVFLPLNIWDGFSFFPHILILEVFFFSLVSRLVGSFLV